MVDSYLKYGSRMFVKRNTVIYEQNTTGDGFYLLVDGKIKISMKVFNGKERILEVQGNGQIFGILSMDNKSYFNSAIALENSIIYYFSSKKFQELILNSNHIRNMVYDSMIEKLKQLVDIIQLNSLSVEQQLANSLLEISRKFNSYEIPLNQQQLSCYTGLTRITIYKITEEWKKSNLIEKKKGNLIIKSPERLQKYVNTF